MTIDLNARYTVTSVPGVIFIPIGYDQNEDETVNYDLVWLHPEGAEPADVYPADELTLIPDEDKYGDERNWDWQFGDDQAITEQETRS